MIAGMQIGEVCSCGHPMRAHHDNGKCEIGRLNCRCSKATPLLVTKNLQAYRHKHGRGAMGHALMLGILSSFDETTLALGQGAELLRCYKCKTRGWELAPVLMDTYSKHISDNPEQGRMTRLWCKDCLIESGRDYPPYLGFLFYREIFHRHHQDS